MCLIEAYYVINPYKTYGSSSGGGRPLPPDSIECDLVSLELTLNFIESCIQSYNTNLEKSVCSERYLG